MLGEEWPIAAPEDGEPADPKVDRARDARGRRLATVLADFFLDPADRLTEQERALMTAMLQALVATAADELRVRLPADLVTASECDPGELTANLGVAGLLQSPSLIRLLLARADTARIAQAMGQGSNGSHHLQRWAAGEEGDLAAAAMALIIARGRSRDRFGKPAVHIHDLDAESAVELVYSVAAALAARVPAPADEAFASAAAALLARHDEAQRSDALAARLVRAMEAAGQLHGESLLELARQGDAPLLAHALGRLGGIDPVDAWAMLVGEEGSLALLLRLAGQPRSIAAGLFATLSDALGLADPASEIDRFDQLPPALVQREGRRLRLPLPYRQAADAVEGHGHRAR